MPLREQAQTLDATYIMNCPMCRGPVRLIGVLGRLAHYLCRSCGAPFHDDYEEEYDEDET